MAVLRHVRKDQTISALPLISDIYLFRYVQSIIDLDTEVFDGAFNLGVAQ